MRALGRSLLPSPWLAALCAGLLTAWAARPREAPPLGAPALWVADREGGALIGLDLDLFCVARLAWPTPVALEPVAARDRGPAGDLLWVASAPRGDPLGGHRLSLVAPTGAGELLALELGRWLDMQATPDGGVVWLEDRGGLRWLARADARGARRAMAAPRGAVRLAAGAAGLIVGTETGELWRFDGAWAAGTRLPGEVCDLAPADAGSGGGWWALAGAEDGLGVLRLGPELEVRGRAALAGAQEGILLVARDSAWVAAGNAARAWRIDPGGTVRDEVPLYLRGVSAGAVGRDGELVFALPGALVRKSPQGDPLPGQGGFEHLVDAAVVAGATP